MKIKDNIKSRVYKVKVYRSHNFPNVEKFIEIPENLNHLSYLTYYFIDKFGENTAVHINIWKNEVVLDKYFNQVLGITQQDKDIKDRMDEELAKKGIKKPEKIEFEVKGFTIRNKNQEKEKEKD